MNDVGIMMLDRNVSMLCGVSNQGKYF